MLGTRDCQLKYEPYGKSCPALRAANSATGALSFVRSQFFGSPTRVASDHQSISRSCGLVGVNTLNENYLGFSVYVLVVTAVAVGLFSFLKPTRIR
jgi:hypothetical protein